MRKFIVISCLFLSGILPLSADLQKHDDIQVVNPLEMTCDEFKSIMQENRGDIALEFTAGSILPLQFFMEGDVISLIGGEKEIGQLKIEKTFYLRITEDNFLFSMNLVDWKPFEDLFTGEGHLGFYSEEEDNPVVIFGAELYQRI